MLCREVCIALLLVCSIGCGTSGEEVTELCEIEMSIEHRPHTIHASQTISPDGVSVFRCTLLTNDASLAGADFFSVLEPKCRAFISRAMEAATRCSGVKFDQTARSVGFEIDRGTGVDGGFFAVQGQAKRVSPN